MTIDYFELAELADRILTIAKDDVDVLAGVIEELDEELRCELFNSDFLNVWQVFYYFYREQPDELALDRMLLHSATELKNMVLIGDEQYRELWFGMDSCVPYMVLKEDGEEVQRFSGAEGFDEGLSALNED